MIEWTFSEEILWGNSCDKCCDDCEAGYNKCEYHCAKAFKDTCFCAGCKYDELTIGK